MNRIIGATLLILALGSLQACATNRYFKISYTSPEGVKYYDIDYGNTDPSYNGKPVNWRFIVQESCGAWGPPYLTTYGWQENGEAIIVKLCPSEDAFRNASKSVETPKKGIIVGLDSKIEIKRMELRTDRKEILSALNTVWEQLGKYTYYEAMGLDGATIAYETFDSSGLRRKLRLWCPDTPPYGSDVARVLGMVSHYVHKVTNPSTCVAYDSTGHEKKWSPDEVLKELNQLVERSINNEPLVRDLRFKLQVQHFPFNGWEVLRWEGATVT